MRTRVLITLVLMSFFTTLLSTGCVRGKKETCSYFIKQLNSPEERPEALKQIQSLACQRAIPKLEPIFKSGSNQLDIIRTVNQVVTKGKSMVESKKNQLERSKDEGEKDRLKQELDFLNQAHSKAQNIGAGILVQGLAVGDTASLCSATIMDWNDAGVFKDWKRVKASAALAKVAEDKTFKQSRSNAVKALASIAPGDKSFESLYIKLTQKDPNAQPMDVFVTSIEQLGEMKSQEGLPQIIRGLFIKNQKKEASSGAARVALGKIGAPAATAVVATLNGEDENFKEWCRRQGIPDWRWQFGPSLLVPLGDLRAPAGADAIMKNLSTPFPDATTIPEAQQGSYIQNVTNRIKVGAMSLATLNQDSILPVAEKLALDKNQHYGLRIDLTWSMALMGSDASRKTLFKIYKNAERDEFKEQVVRFLALTMKADDRKEFEKVVLKKAAKLPFVSKRLETEQVVSYRAVVDECADKRDSCLLNLLKPLNLEENEDMDADEKKKAERLHRAKQEKAALWIAHLDKNNDKFFKASLDAFRESKAVYADLKRYLFMAIAKHANKGDLKELKILHDDIKGNKRLGLIAWDLKMFNIFLER